MINLGYKLNTKGNTLTKSRNQRNHRHSEMQQTRQRK